MGFCLEASAQRELAPNSLREELVGFWEQMGDGRILRIRNQQVSVFHKTNSSIYLDTKASAFPIEKHFARWSVSNDGSTLKTWRWDFDDRCESQFYEEYRRLGALPSSTIESPEKDERFQNPVFVFDLFCEHFDEHFPHFERRRFDWEKRKQQARAQLNRDDSPEKLYGVLCEMLRGLGDSHTRVYWNDRQFKSGSANVLAALESAFEDQSEIKSQGIFNSNWARKMKSTIQEHLSSEIAFAADGRFRWAILKGDIGYIENDLITAFSPNGTPRSKELAILERELDGMMDQLKECRAILLDLSFNQGGYEPAAMMIASRFADQRRHVYTQSARGQPPRKFFVAPRGKAQFTKPLFVLTSNSTVSCGETLTLMLKAFPHTVQIGEPTRGCLSSFLNKSFPHGFHLTLSNEIYESPGGTIAEGSGVQPDISFAVFEPERLNRSYPDAIARALLEISRSL